MQTSDHPCQRYNGYDVSSADVALCTDPKPTTAARPPCPNKLICPNTKQIRSTCNTFNDYKTCDCSEGYSLDADGWCSIPPIVSNFQAFGHIIPLPAESIGPHDQMGITYDFIGTTYFFADIFLVSTLDEEPDVGEGLEPMWDYKPVQSGDYRFGGRIISFSQRPPSRSTYAPNPPLDLP